MTLHLESSYLIGVWCCKELQKRPQGYSHVKLPMLRDILLPTSFSLTSNVSQSFLKFFSHLSWKSLTQKVFFCIHKDQRNFCIQLLKNFFKDKPSFSVARKFIAQLKTLIFFVPLANKF